MADAGPGAVSTIKISMEELEEEKKDSKSLLSRLKFWESDTETAMTKDMPVEKESKAIPIEEKSVDVIQAEEKLLSQVTGEPVWFSPCRICRIAAIRFWRDWGSLASPSLVALCAVLQLSE